MVLLNAMSRGLRKCVRYRSCIPERYRCIPTTNTDVVLFLRSNVFTQVVKRRFRIALVVFPSVEGLRALERPMFPGTVSAQLSTSCSR